MTKDRFSIKGVVYQLRILSSADPLATLEDCRRDFALMKELDLNTVRVYQLAVDLLNPSHALEQKTHKLKRLVQSPNSYFMDVKCPGCVQITTVFSHAQTVVMCSSCANVLAQPTGGITRLTEGCSFRRKQA
ncbi:40S ribosomal protein S27 [Podila epicladia]|nr:40S ribosomal protein S27 [Podila epicladia]